MNFKTVLLLCMLVIIGSSFDYKNKKHKSYTGIKLNGDSPKAPQGPSRRLIEEDTIANHEDVEGTVAFFDGKCVVVRTCLKKADYNDKLVCTEEHVCEM